METVFKTRLKIICESVQTAVTAAQCALTKFSEFGGDLKELHLIGSKLKRANERFVPEIRSYCTSTTSSDIDEIGEYTSMQIQAEDLLTDIEVVLEQEGRNHHHHSENNDNINISSKLPKLELSKYNGDVLNWYQFWDQFASNVHNRKISDVDKMLYLQSVLEGDAKQAIEGLDTTNRNYSIAINTLKERYGKPSTIIDAHYVALYRVKPAPSSQVKDCRQVLNEIERHLRVLSSLGENVNHNHLRVMIMEKFPEEIIYELRMKMTEEDDSIDSIRKYLEYIISAREASNRLKKQAENQSTRVDDKFTTSSLHVKSFDSKSSEHPRKSNNFKYKERQFNNPRKRPHERSSEPYEPSTKIVRKCIFCQQNHFNDECTSYTTLQDRKAKLGKRCYNCFSETHLAKRCNNKRKCRHCGKYGFHNRALCSKKTTPSAPPKQKEKTSGLHVKSQGNTTLLQTCVVDICHSDFDAKRLHCRVLLDCGSQRSYITETAANSLNLPSIEKVNLAIFTFGTQSPRQMESPIVSFQLKTRTGITTHIHANVVPHITHGIRTPPSRNTTKLWNNDLVQDITFADDGSCGDSIDILIGNDYYYSFMLNEKIEVADDLFLVNSDFGWVWSGKTDETVDKADQLSVLTYFQSSATVDHKLHEPDLPLRVDDVKKLWDLESIGITDCPKLTRDEDAIRQFNDTVQFSDNRYQVKWPWADYPPSLPDNLGLAWGRLNSLIKRLSEAEVELYDQVIQDQLRNGIIEEILDPTAPENHPVHYLPHHCVRSQDKPGKLRIVYDASAKVANNHSLNECLYRGPLMLEDLTGLLIKFREHPIGIIADVEKAFLQVGLQETDRDVTRFLWLKDKTRGTSRDNIRHFRFCRVPFGIVSSPFLLNATIKYHLIRFDSDIMKQIGEDLYVDNIVTGMKTTSEAIALYEATRQTFKSLSMNLREWNSNSKGMIDHIPEELRQRSGKSVKVLGLMWNTDSDQLSLNIKVNIEELDKVKTKREVLKIIAAIYDPCGYGVPIILPAKLFFQKLWQTKIKWDVKFDENLQTEWQQITANLKYLEEIHLSRHYAQNPRERTNDTEIQFELHCFTDASKEAYSAVVYLRSGFSPTSNIVNFVIGKSRLVPLKNQNDLQIPRLELLGALIGCRLLRYLRKYMRLNVKAQYLWTDSQIVLSWHKSRRLLPPFVTRRINEIKETKDLQLRYVPSKLNPADIGTRPDRIQSYKTWLKGPDFLKRDYKQWPRVEDIHDQNLVTSIVELSDVIEPIQSQGTNRQKDPSQNSDLTNQILLIQGQYFQKEKAGKETDLTRSLKLYIDQDGIIRCRGRFKNTDLSHDQKEPILLPKNAEFTEKIISEIHQKNYHVGVSHTLALVRKCYWIPHGRATVQRVLKKCLRCKKYTGGPYKLPPMPHLPAERVKFCRPFAFTGIDYFGPLYVNEGAKEKRWVCLLTCLTVRAIHMEVVKDLTAEECLLAIRRFTAMRGLPQLFVSDNALQFKLTAEVLTSDYCIENKIRWNFIPELAPWFGGFYERLIGIVKNCMKKTLDKHTINHNQLCTIIKEIEAIVNTRPLTTVGAEPEHVLTPADFLLVGGPVVFEAAERNFREPATITKSNLIDGWKRGQMILQETIEMFRNQYLTSLRERNDKHKQPRVVVKKTPQISDIVQIKSDSKRAHWRVGKISEVVQGADGQIRVAKVKLPTGETFTRSVSHLYPLEVGEDTAPTTSNTSEEVTDNSTSTVEERINTHEPPNSQNVTLPQQENFESQTENHITSHTLPSDKNQTSDTPEPETLRSSINRPQRTAAVKAREKLREWTSQLVMSLFEQ